LSFVAITLLLARFGLAQTQLVASDPQMGAVIRRHSIVFSLRFNHRVEASQCSLSLRMPTAEQRALSLQAQTASDRIEAPGINLGSGSYVLSWQIKTPGAPATVGTVNFSVR
jgi:methionine-rich copper-binding protein CopC